jgi:AraC-like DNA-binding protein
MVVDLMGLSHMANVKPIYKFVKMASATAKNVCNFYGTDRCAAQVAGRRPPTDQVQNLNWLNFNGIDLLSTGYGDDVDIKVDSPEDALIFYLPISGNMEIRQKRGHSVDASGPVAVAGLDCRSVGLASRRRHIRIGLARRNLMARLDSAGLAHDHQSLRFAERLNVGELAGVLSTLALSSFASFTADRDVNTERLAALGSTIESAVLNLWPNSVLDRLASMERAIYPRQVKLAMDFIAADPFRTIAVADIARHCGVSVRSLQYGFSNFASCSIREFILRERLRALEKARFDPCYLDALLAKVGLRQLESLNRRHERSCGRPLIPWQQLGECAG